MDNDVTIFDLKTLKVLGKVKTGTNPDSIIYEPVTHRVLTFNGRSSDSTVFDAKTGEIVAASIPLGGKPEFSQVDGKGHVYFNLEDKNEIGEIDAKTATLTKHYSIAPCDGPSGLAIDPKNSYLFSVCGNKMMIVSDPADRQSHRDSCHRAGSRRRGFRRRLCVQRERPRRQHHHGRRNIAGQIRTRRDHPDPGRAPAPSAPIRRPISSICRPPNSDRPPPPPAGGGRAGRPQALPDSFEIIVVGRN